MKNLYFLPTFLLTVFLTLSLSSFDIQNNQGEKNTDAELFFTVTTITANGSFAPRHVLAIWIEDSNGFVKSRKVMANQRKQYLYTWRSVSNENEVDAITGSTLTSHQTHSISWDCRDLNGDVVPDGDYTVYIEFTEKHAQGPLFSLTFTKGANEQTLTPADENNFKDIELIFTPAVQSISELEGEAVKLFPNPSNGDVSIRFSDDQSYELLEIYSLDGKLFKEYVIQNQGRIDLNLSNLQKGIYLFKFSTEDHTFFRKFIKN